MTELTNIERNALHFALSGPETWKQQLRQQIRSLDVKSREDTGAGILSYFRLKEGTPLADIPPAAYKIPPEIRASHPEIPGGVVFLVWLGNGTIDFLEIASGKTPLPDQELFVFGNT